MMGQHHVHHHDVAGVVGYHRADEPLKGLWRHDASARDIDKLAIGKESAAAEYTDRETFPIS